MCSVWPPCLPRSIHKLSAQNEVLYFASWSLVLRSSRKGASPRTSRSPSVTRCGKMTEAQLRPENSPGMPQSTPPMALAGRTGPRKWRFGRSWNMTRGIFQKAVFSHSANDLSNTQNRARPVSGRNGGGIAEEPVNSSETSRAAVGSAWSSARPVIRAPNPTP
jgi:hypothetical protein